MEFCWKFYGSVKFKMVLFSLLMYPLVLNGMNTSCEYIQRMETGQKFYTYNIEYPDYYKGLRYSAWCTESLNNIKVRCSIEMSSSRDCYQEELTFQFAGSNVFAFCGNITFVLEGLNPIIKFYSRQNWHNSRFLCELEALDSLEDNCDCGWKKETKIVGGEETGVNEYPMMCGLVDIGKKLIYCGCTIISHQYVLTAAHCVENRNINQIGVVVGEHDVTTGEDTNATRLFPISKCTIHYGYNQDMVDFNDIAVCEVSGIIDYTSEVGPVCLPFAHRSDSFENDNVTVLGWGLLKYGGPKSTVLQEADVNVISLKECKEYYSNVTNRNLCTYTSGKDTCEMDTGGPILWQNNMTHKLVMVGITGSGIRCASNYSSIAMRVGAFIDWIVSVTPGARYCTVE